MSEKIRVDAGLMREHRAHDVLIEDEPEKRVSGVWVGLLLTLLALACAIGAYLAVTGCSTMGTLPDIPWPGPAATNDTGTVTTTQPPVVAGDDLGISGLSWDIGGFDGSKAVRDPNAKVSNASLSMSALKWDVHGLESWPNDRKTYGVDCLWVGKETATSGGKFDWSRIGNGVVRPTYAHVQGNGTGFYRGGDMTAREFEQIAREWAGLGGYKVGYAWKAGSFSKDGKKRTNIVGGVVK